MAKFRGLTRVRRNGREVEGSTWLARLEVPADVRAIIAMTPEADPRRGLFIGPNGKPKHELLETTGHVDMREASRVAEGIIARWKADIAALRQRGNPTDVEAALRQIEDWRSHAVAWALGFDAMIALADSADGGRVGITTDQGSPKVRLTHREGAHGLLQGPAPGITHGAAMWARSFFAAAPGVDTDLGVPLPTAQLIGQLDAAAVSTERWREIDGFDAFLAQEIGRVDPKVLGPIRPAFAKAWREVALAREAERRFAATIVALIAASSSPVNLEPASGYAPRAGDRSVGDLLDAYAAEYERVHDATKDTVAPIRALREFLGEKTPARAIDNDDGRAFAAFVETIPVNAGKFYPDRPLREAIERASKDKRRPISRTTARRYMTFASMIWRWGTKNGYADRNPFIGLAGPKAASVRRVGFTNAELVALFNHLQPHKAAGKALFWVPALGLNGARISELLQIRTDDVKEADGVIYLDLSPFDEAGRRDGSKRHKNEGSVRLAPIHPLCINAGFMDLVQRRQAEGAERLFPEIKPRTQKGGKVDWGHYYSKQINRVLDKAVSDAPRLVGGHGFRHTLRERYRKLGVLEEVVDAIGGWSQKSVGRRYGDTDIELLSENLAKFDFGPLKL